MENQYKVFNTKDAIGNEIVIGASYGYSQSKNGFTNIRVGKAIAFTEKGLLTLQVTESRRALWMNEAETETVKETIHVKPVSLFKL